jgi:hypothetical protein
MCQEGFSWVGPGEENARKGDGQAPLTTVFVQAHARRTSHDAGDGPAPSTRASFLSTDALRSARARERETW